MWRERVYAYDVANDERLVIDRLHRSRLRIEGARAAGSCAWQWPSLIRSSNISARLISIVVHARNQISRAHAFLRDTHPAILTRGLAAIFGNYETLRNRKRKSTRVSLHGIDRSCCSRYVDVVRTIKDLTEEIMVDRKIFFFYVVEFKQEVLFVKFQKKWSDWLIWGETHICFCHICHMY